MTESNHNGGKWCPHCKLQGVKSRMENLSEKILGCKKCKYLESDISKKITTPFTCPRCALEGIKSDLKDYPNQSGINQIVYPVRDAIPIANPFFIILIGIFFVLTVGSYYAFASFIGRTRFFNSVLAASFATTVISFYFSLAGWVSPLHVLTFIGITVLSFMLTIFYK